MVDLTFHFLMFKVIKLEDWIKHLEIFDCAVFLFLFIYFIFMKAT